MPLFLHVGCGMKRKDRTTPGFASSEWQERRFDIDPTVAPDVLGSMTDMSAIADGSADALFSSHNIEHLYPHEVGIALREFHRVLSPEGFAVITCPDLQSIAQLVANDRLTEAAYKSPAGPISPLDMLYGHRPSMAAGNLFMAHRTGFTLRSLATELRAAGFQATIARRQAPPAFALWIAASKTHQPEATLRNLAAEHFPS